MVGRKYLLSVWKNSSKNEVCSEQINMKDIV